MIGRVGIVCPVCGKSLRVLQVRAYLIGWKCQTWRVPEVNPSNDQSEQRK
jgi:hypothetical protein